MSTLANVVEQNAFLFLPNRLAFVPDYGITPEAHLVSVFITDPPESTLGYGSIRFNFKIKHLLW